MYIYPHTLVLKRKQHVHRFQNKDCINNNQTSCIYYMLVKIGIFLPSVAILFSISVCVHLYIYNDHTQRKCFEKEPNIFLTTYILKKEKKITL